jgi:hypothetical protein
MINFKNVHISDDITANVMNIKQVIVTVVNIFLSLFTGELSLGTQQRHINFSVQTEPDYLQGRARGYCLLHA